MAKPYYVIEVRPPDAPADRFEIEDAELILGRSKKRADIILADSQASSSHAKLSFDGRAVTLTDLQSTNGTTVDGRKISSEVRLSRGRSFKIGETEVVLTEIEGDEPPTMPLHIDEATRALDPSQLLAEAGAAAHNPDATVAFDRASIPIGDFERGWTGGQPQAEDDPEDEPHSGRLVGGVIGVLALVLAAYAIAIAVLLAIQPSADDLGLTSLEADHPASAPMAIANSSWRFVNTEYRFVSVLGSNRYENVERHYKRAAAAYATVIDKEASRPDKREAVATLLESAETCKHGARMMAKKLDDLRLGLFITMGVAVVSGLLIFFGLRRTGGFLLLAGVIGPMAVRQPVHPEPLIFTGVFALLAIAAIVSGFLLARR